MVGDGETFLAGRNVVEEVFVFRRAR